jgi:hypothetical protein
VFSGNCNDPCTAGYTYVPDNNFEQALIDLGYDTPPLDNYVLTATISGVTVLDVNAKSISDLTGIEAFVSLTLLNVETNLLTSLDIISGNTALTTLSCGHNSLSSLDVSNQTALSTLHCYNNLLTSLDVSGNTALGALNCSNNQLTTLDMTQNTALTYLSCGTNLLTCLNVKNGNNVAMGTSFYAVSNSLTCITVDNVAYSTTNWTYIDGGVTFSTSICLGC